MTAPGLPTALGGRRHPMKDRGTMCSEAAIRDRIAVGQAELELLLTQLLVLERACRNERARGLAAMARRTGEMVRRRLLQAQVECLFGGELDSDAGATSP